MIESGWPRHTHSVKKYVASLAPLVALLMLACDKQGSSENGSAEAGVDGEGDDGWGEGNGDETSSPGDGDCEEGEYVSLSYNESPDWSNLSGMVNHDISHGTPLSTQLVDARFFTTDYVDASLSCIETLVEPIGVDSCWVWYTRGERKGVETPDYWYDDLPVVTATFDVGDGPIPLDVTGGTASGPSWYSAELPSPTPGVPFGQVVTLTATFDGLPDISLDLDVPSDILPLDHALDVTTLSSEELASWTWSTPGGDAPIELQVTFGATPAGTGWSEVVRIQCEVTDDGEFAFPV
jgi:hypothetical protein